MISVRWRAVLTLLASLAMVPGAAVAQTPPAKVSPAVQQISPSASRLRVFLDCDCFQTFLREEIDWVDWVVQPQDADVHLLSNWSDTGAGGSEIALRFVGRGRFQGVDQELKAITLPNDSEDTKRRLVLRTVTIGLLGYMARAGLHGNMEISVEAAKAAAAVPIRDPWNLWVYQVEVEGSMRAEELNQSRRISLGASADRVTALWKISLGAHANRNRERFTIEADDDEENPSAGATLVTDSRQSNANGFVARSLGPHWSYAVQGGSSSSTFGNTKLGASLGTGFEYSVFPYTEYTTRQLVAQFMGFIEHASYYEVTLFDRLSETHPRQLLSLRYDRRAPWGSAQAGVEFTQYLHDLSKYRLAGSGEIDYRITRGWSVAFEGNVSRIRDQLSLPKRNASPSETLLKLRQLQSGYEVEFQFGISYRFGSLFNNVVNPRFGR